MSVSQFWLIFANWMLVTVHGLSSALLVERAFLHHFYYSLHCCSAVVELFVNPKFKAKNSSKGKFVRES